MKRSIEETINYRLLFMGMVSLVLTAALTIFMFHQSFSHQVEHDLELTTRSVASSYALSGDERVLEVSAQDSLRITLIAQDGSVLYDSAAGTVLENHLERPEVQQALHSDNGVGIAQRESSTVGYRTYYCALRMESGDVLRLGLDAASTYGFFDEALPAIVVSCMVILGLSVLASWLLTRSLVRPIVQMGEDLEHIEDHVPYAELVPFAQTIQSDRLLRQNNERMRREFTANVSHELKTPLTSISGYAELIEAGMAKPQDVTVFAGRIRTEAARLQSLVADIIQLSQLDDMSSEAAEGQAPEQAKFAPVSLLALARRCTESLALNAQKAYVTLLAEGEDLTVQGDQRLLEELCFNLCDNAIRYNRPGGRVILHVETRDGHPTLRVEDNGIGISPEHQARVFERFYRVDKSRSKATGGTGLGLAIVKHIALLHGAQLKLESREGEGTTITVLFPVPGKK